MRTDWKGLYMALFEEHKKLKEEVEQLREHVVTHTTAIFDNEGPMKSLLTYNDHVELKTNNTVFMCDKRERFVSIGGAPTVLITVTLDQRRFKYTNQNDQKDYIRLILGRLPYKYHIQELYGAFEQQKNGWIHAHLLCSFVSHSELIQYVPLIRDFLTKAFSKTITNRRCIDIRTLRNEKGIEYVNKEDMIKEYFYFINNGLLIDEEIEVDKQDVDLLVEVFKQWRVRQFHMRYLKEIARDNFNWKAYKKTMI